MVFREVIGVYTANYMTNKYILLDRNELLDVKARGKCNNRYV